MNNSAIFQETFYELKNQVPQQNHFIRKNPQNTKYHPQNSEEKGDSGNIFIFNVTIDRNNNVSED